MNFIKELLLEQYILKMQDQLKLDDEWSPKDDIRRKKLSAIRELLKYYNDEYTARFNDETKA